MNKDELNREVEQIAQRVFEEIKHGDAQHQEWLLTTLRSSKALEAFAPALVVQGMEEVLKIAEECDGDLDFALWKLKNEIQRIKEGA
jgi:hypothetical protein